MMKRLLALLILMFTLLSFAVEAKSELESELDQITDASDTSIKRLESILARENVQNSPLQKMQVLDKLARTSNSAGKRKEALVITEEIISLAEANKNDSMLAEAYFIQSQIAKSGGDYSKAAEILETKAIPLAESNQFEFVANYYRVLGIYKRNLGKLSEAEKLYSKALSIYEKNEDELNMGKTYSSLGVLFETRGEMKPAFENHLKARVIFEKYNDIDQLATNYFNLGEMYRRTEDPDKATELFKRALDMDIQRNNKSDMAYSYTKVASMLEFQGNIEEALNHSEKGVNLFDELGDNRMLSWALPLYGRLNKKLGNNEGYFRSLKLTEKAAIASGSKVQIRNVYQMLALHHYHNNNLELAREKIELSVDAMEGLDQDVLTHDIHSIFAKIANKQGDKEKAFEQLRLAHGLYITLNENKHAEAQERFKKDVNLLEEQFKVNELEKENFLQQQALEQEKTQRIFILIVASAFLIVVLMFAYLQYNRRKLAVYKSDLVVDSLDKKNAYLAEVAHDLRHPLSVLSNHLEALEDGIVEPTEKSFKTLHGRIQQLNRLVGDLRSASLVEIGALSLHTRPTQIRAFVEEQVELYQPLISKASLNLEYDLTASEDLSLEIDKDRIAQVIGNLIKNCVRYTNKGGKIRVSSRADQEYFKLTIEDSAPSVKDDEFSKLFDSLYRSDSTKSMSEKGSGLGLSISKSIVEAHEGTITAHLSELGGVAVEVTLPIEN